MYFDYPIDSKSLIRKKRQIKKDFLSKETKYIEKRIAVLGGSTTNEVVDQIELFLLNYGIKPIFYQSEYGKYMEDALFGNSVLDGFNPDIIYLHTNWRNIAVFPTITSTKEETNTLLEKEFNKFKSIWNSIEKRYACPIIQNNFDRPNYRLFGNKDISDYHGRTNFISRLNQKLYEFSQCNKNFYINDLDYLASDYGYSAWQDSLYWHMYKYAMCLDAIPYLADSVAKIIKALLGKNKKAVALDLDNTLWGGVVGDDGVEGIAIGPEIPAGQVYSEFQAYCKAQKDIGVILGIDSKNEERNALAGLNHPDSILKPNDFVSIKANWKSKDENLKSMAKELNLGIDSFVFVDDNPAEREIIRKQIPEVAVPEIDQIENYIKVLDHSGYFEVVTLSVEDLKKTELYHAKIEAEKASAAFTDYGDYLDSLQMKAIIKPFDELHYQRIAQLTNKTNQFNLTTLRCTEEDIRKMMDSDEYITLYGKLEDKYGDNGVVTVVAGKKNGKTLLINLWLMSCRVLMRELEIAMMDVLIEKAESYGIDKVIGFYYPTEKNNMVKDFYKDMGFNLCSKEESESRWEIEIKDYQKKTKHIKIITEIR